MNTRRLMVFVFSAVTLFVTRLRAQDSIVTKTYVEHVRPLHAASTVQDSTGAPPDYVPVEKQPRIIRQAVPAYAEVALRDSIEGRIIVKLWVDKDGKPHQAIILKRILEAGGKELQIQGTLEHGYVVIRGDRVDAAVFDQPTIDAAMKYRFTPAIMNGKPVAVWVVIPFTFKLKPDNESAPNSSQRIENAGLNKPVEKQNPEAARLTELISEYNTAMYHERMKEYIKAVENYKEFLRDAEKARLKTGEMERHAREMIEKYSKMQKDGK